MKCEYKECDRDAGEYRFCSIECACYSGKFSVTKGWLDDTDKSRNNKSNKTTPKQ